MLFRKTLSKYLRKSKFIKQGTSVYLLRQLFIICKDNLMIKKKNAKDYIYLLTKNFSFRTIKAPDVNEREENKVINDMQSLIDFSLAKCDLEENVDYKINILNENFIPIENDNQLLNYTGDILYCKITEVSTRNKNNYEENYSTDKFIINSTLLCAKQNFQSQTSPKMNNSYKALDQSEQKNEKIGNDDKDNKPYLPQILLLHRKQIQTNLDGNSTSSINYSKTMSMNKEPSMMYTNKPPIKTIINPKPIRELRKESKPIYFKIHQVFPQSSSTNDLSIIPTKIFPIRGRMTQKRIKRSQSTGNYNISQLEYSSSSPNITKMLNPYAFITHRTNKQKEDEKVEYLKSFLLSKSSFDILENRTKDIIREHDNDVIKQEYTGFLLELRQAVLQLLNNIVSDSMVLIYPKYDSLLNYNSSYEKEFPFNQCIKEYILYCYLSDFCLKQKENILNAFNNQEQIKMNDIIKCINDIKEELRRVVHNPNELSIFLKNKAKDMSLILNSVFFEIFVLCADFFNGNQSSFAEQILLILEVDDQSKTISYNSFTNYYLYFRCYDLVTNEQKFQFIKKILTLVYGKETYNEKLNNYSNFQIEIRRILNIDELTMKCFKKEFSYINNIDIAKRYSKIDTIYANMVNYFTYQH